MHHYLTDEQLDSYKQRLIKKRQDIQVSLDAKKQETQVNHAAEADLIDIASNVEIRERLVSEIDRDTRALAKIDLALKNFDDDFGYCIDCGVEIGNKRLDFDPSASRCFDCQDIFEKKSRLYAK